MHLVCNTNITLGWKGMLPLHGKFNRFRDMKPTCQIPNSRLYRCAKIRIRHLHMKRWIDVKWCVINLCFGRDRLKDEVKQLLILPIVVFHVLSAYILCVSNHISVFGCSDPGCYFRFVGLLQVLVQYIIIVDVVDLFNNGIHTCILFSSRFNRVWLLKIIHVDNVLGLGAAGGDHSCLLAPWWQIWEHLTHLTYSAFRNRGPRPPRYNEARLYQPWTRSARERKRKRQWHDDIANHGQDQPKTEKAEDTMAWWHGQDHQRQRTRQWRDDITNHGHEQPKTEKAEETMAWWHYQP